MNKKVISVLVIFIFVIFVIAGALQASFQASAEEGGPTAYDQTAPRIAVHAQTGKVRFYAAGEGEVLEQPSALPASATPEFAARSFLAVNGEMFGVKDQAAELALMKELSPGPGRSGVRFQQVFKGVPIFGGELIVQMDANLDVLSVSGEILPDIAVDVLPAVDAVAAGQNALATIAKQYGLAVEALSVSEPELWIYNPILIRPGGGFTSLVWRMEVSPLEGLEFRELVLVEAQRGAVVLNFNQIDTARNRMTYTANNGTSLPGTLVCNEANPNCTGGDTHAVNAHVYAGDTYDFYASYHGRDSINNAGMTLVSTVHYSSGYCNAFWNGSQMVYGDGCFLVVDDVVAHEMTHGVTQYESDLFYYYQSGAINESLSDIWGEFVDLTNGKGNDAAGVRWYMGEDASTGAIRNMKNPPEFSDPDKMTSANYYTDSGDNGGVHTNSGILNKATYLLTDGDTFNTYTVTGLGITKVAKIVYEAQTNLLTSGADYADLHNALQQACSNLVGTSGITSGDCAEVLDAVEATEMDLQPVADFNVDAEICTGGQTPTNVFYDTIESGTGNWTFGALTGTNRWRLDSPYGSFAHSGLHFLYADDYPAAVTDTYAVMNSGVVIPANAFLHFAHAYHFEAPNYDGGVLEYTTNNGSTWNDAASLFEVNGYDGAINSGYGNPLGGRNGFLGISHGYISSRLNLSTLAGQTVRFRWRMGLDASVYKWGWWLDDVRIYTCGGGGVGPDITVSPTSFEVTLPVDGITTRTLTLGNVGSASLDFSISEVNVSSPLMAADAGLLDGEPTGEPDAQGVVPGFISPKTLTPDPAALAGLKILVYGQNTGEIDRLTSLGMNVTTLSAPADLPGVINNYDIFYPGLATIVNLSPYQSTIAAYVQGGGGLVVEQPNTIGAIGMMPTGFEITVSDTYWPGYSASPDPGLTAAAASHPITQGLTGANLSHNFDTIYTSNIGAGFTVLATHSTTVTDVVALAAGTYGSGRVVLHTGNLNPTSVDPGSDQYLDQLFTWAAGGSSSGLNTYTNRGTFDAACPGLPVETFENTLVANGTIVSCTGPFNSSTNNACFAPGGILAGISLMNADPVSQMVVIGDNGLGSHSALVGPNTFSDHQDIFFPGGNVFAVGFDLANPGTPTFDIAVYGPGDVLLGTSSSASNLPGVFWGVKSDQPIARIRTTSAATDMNGGELFDNIAFGGCFSDVPWLSESPTSGTVPASGQANVTVGFDATGLAEGDYTANLVIDTNDPDEDPVVVPVTLHVSSGSAAYLPYVGINTLSIFKDRTTFTTICPNMPTEGFEKTRVEDGNIVSCPGPFNSSTNNDCFGPGGILTGISLMNVDSGSDMVVIGDNALGSHTALVGPNSFADHQDIFFTAGNVYAVGFDLINPYGAYQFDISIYGAGDVLLGTSSSVTGLPGVFWGVKSGKPITRIRTNSAAGEGELFDNITFGGCGLP